METQRTSINEGFALWEQFIEHHHPKKTLLVCGKESYQAVKSEVAPLFAKLSGETIVFNDFGKKPCIEDIFCGVQLCRREKVDLIIAVGGGHCIDTAKAINILSDQPHAMEHVKDIKGYIQGNRAMVATKRPLMVMPTTCGSGSEATHFAVVYIGADKFSLAHPSILADWAIIDECLVRNLPKPIAIYTALDALCQAIESYWSVGATKESESYALKSLKIISPHTKKEFGTENTFFSDMAMAANYSGRAINISKTTAPHALSYYLTDQFAVPHGVAVALTLGSIAAYTEKNAKPSTREKIQTIKEMLRFSADFSQSWDEFLHKLNIPCRLSDYALTKQHLSSMVHSVNLQRLANHPFAFTAEQLMQIVEARY